MLKQVWGFLYKKNPNFNMNNVSILYDFLVTDPAKKSPDHRLSLKPPEAQFLLMIWKSSQCAVKFSAHYIRNSLVVTQQAMVVPEPNNVRLSYSSNKPLSMIIPYHL